MSDKAELADWVVGYVAGDDMYVCGNVMAIGEKRITVDVVTPHSRQGGYVMIPHGQYSVEDYGITVVDPKLERKDGE